MQKFANNSLHLRGFTVNIKKNQVVELEITDITNLGFGVGRYGGVVVFVSDAVTGDVVRAKIIKVGGGFTVGRVEEYIKRSPYRTSDRCTLTACKSCAYKSILYAKELEIKGEIIRSAFKKCGLSDVTLTEVIPSPSLCSYRNKAQYPIAKAPSGDYLIGFYAPKSHRVTEAAACPLAPAEFPEILEDLRAFFGKHSISVYDEESGEGLLRHIYLRRGDISGEILLTLVLNGTSLPHSDELVSLLTSKCEKLVGILLNVNKKITNVILGDKFITLFGRDYIFDTLCGVELKITAPSFYQVNHDAAELLYSEAKKLANPQKSDTLLDLYCGAGSIGLTMADDCREVIGVEIVESAVDCAKFNAELNEIKNASFYAADAKNTESLLSRAEAQRDEKIQPDIIILDPPRAGCDAGLLSYVASLLPRKIIYISCNPQTLARDVAILRPLGYSANEVTGVDLFPGTGHVESVVCLKRQIQQ